MTKSTATEPPTDGGSDGGGADGTAAPDPITAGPAPDEPQQSEDQADEADSKSAGASNPRRSRPSGGTRSRPSSVANDGAGLVLALLVWGWVVLPYFKGGKDQVWDVLRAKFTNQGPDGPLP